MTATKTASPRRILYVVGEDYWFLMSRLPMARAARRAGFEVHVATNVNKRGKEIEAEGFILHSIPFRRGGLSPVGAIPTVLAIRRVQKKINPDVMHLAGLQCCVYGSVATLGRKVPLVNAITGLGYIFTSVNWQTRLLRQGMVLLLPWLLNRQSSFVLVQNPDDRSTLVDLGIKPTRMTLIPGSGVDTEALQPLPEPQGPLTFGFAGRLLVDKGIRALVAAHEILRSRGYNFNLLIAGSPDPANPTSISRKEIEQWIQSPGITWLGHVDDIGSFWRSCNFAVLPSHREGLPITLLEAAACGRPLIATDAPGCREIVIEDQTGLLVPIESPADLAQAILRLAESPHLRARYGEAARKLVVDKLSARIIGSSVVQLYDQLTLDGLSAGTLEARGGPRGGKVILVSQHYAPFPSSTSSYMTDIAEELARQGRVLVITSAPGSASKSPPTAGKPEVIEIKSWWPGKSALVSRTFAAVLFSIQVFLAVLRHARSDDALLSVTTPFTLPYTVTLAARLRKAASALLIYDLYPDSLVMAGFLHADSFLTRLLRWANKVMFGWLDAIIIIGRDMAPKLLAYRKVSASRISLIPNWATMPVGYREVSAENPYRQRCGGKFIVAMSGNAGFTHDPMSVLEAARILKDRPDITFMLSGEGVGWSKIKEMHASSPIPNVTLIERVPESELESFLSAGDVWIVPYRKNNTGVSVPSRIYNLFAIGRPIIICSEADAEAAILLREENIGWVTPPEDPLALARVIEFAASNVTSTKERGHRAVVVASRYTRQIALSAYRDLMDKLLAGRLSGKRNALKTAA
ncbi:glycosyltransferase [Bradyrhizobium sp.]|uniref:glycosyltransferase n=1 Tax=Bradyrhizobium sp. TaxID=376 RepID=UPI003BB083F7